jgi:hypothetical protein
MSPADYERFVAEAVRQMRFCRHGAVSTNRKFPGKRQPGEYEIDVAVEISFSASLYFLIIIECKNWLRPVDRPVIQKLLQTRDAIAAHKAAVASPVGFSDEAVEVAKVNGVALWVIAPGTWHVVLAHIGFPPPEMMYYHQLRSGFLQALGILAPGSAPSAPVDADFSRADRSLLDLEVRDYSSVGPHEKPSPPFNMFLQTYYGDYTEAANEPAHAFNPLIAEVFSFIIRHPDWRQPAALKPLAQWENEARVLLSTAGLSEERIPIAIQRVVSREAWRFCSAFKKNKDWTL